MDVMADICERKNIRDMIQTVSSGEACYPARLKEIPSYPGTLYYIGDISVLSGRCAAVVGSRKTNVYGRKVAVSAGKRLAEKGICVVSGMAVGIDSCAHNGALEAGGKTAAVLGCGVDICYPQANLALRDDIARKGLVLSEYPPGTGPRKYHFPQRNRIISGLSELTVVVQAGLASGALITADMAAEQGRDVYAVPGNIDSEYALGSNKLIKDGAIPLLSMSDLLEAMGVCGMDDDEAVRLLGPEEKQVYDMLKTTGEMTADEISMRLSMPAGRVNGIVSVMEMKGAVFSALGKIFIAKT